MFRVFSAESKQDVYSTKILLEKIFSNKKNSSYPFTMISPYYSHISFCRFIKLSNIFFIKNICIYCGMNTNYINF